MRRSVGLDVFDVFGRAVMPPDRDFAAPPGYRFAWAGEDEIAACDPRHTELDERERAEGIVRLSLGHRAVIAFHGDTAVFTMWANPRNVNVPGMIKRRLGPHQTFIYKAFTSPEHRGRKLYESGMRFVLADMAREGKTELVGYAHVDKLVSRKGLAALSFRSLGRFAVLRAPGWTRTLVGRTLAASFPEATPRTGVVLERLASIQR